MPIIGNGDIASVLIDRPDRLYFASGVSNSKETKESEYGREKDLLGKQRRDLQIVYFGSLAILYSNTRYTQHKLEMESLIREFPAYAILRLGNITWGDNPHTLINYLRNERKSGRDPEIQDVFRYILTKEQLLLAIGQIPVGKYEVNLYGTKMKVRDIYNLYCQE